MKLKVALSKSHNKYESLIGEAQQHNKALPSELVDQENFHLGLDSLQKDKTVEDNKLEEFKNQNSNQTDSQFADEQDTQNSKKMTVNTFPLKTEDVTKVDFFLTELFESGMSKNEILAEVSKFCKENKTRREKILQSYKSTLVKKKRTKAQYENIAGASKPMETQKNLVYFMQCHERVKMEVNLGTSAKSPNANFRMSNSDTYNSRKQCDENTLKKKNNVKQFNVADKRRVMELLL